MRKTNLKFLSLMLSIATFLPNVSVRGLDSSKNSYDVSSHKESRGLSTLLSDMPELSTVGAAGAASLLASLEIVGACFLAKDRSPFVSRNYSGLSNANFYNSHNLCFWHALLQQLYDVKAFRKFINSVNLDTIGNSDTRCKIEKLRELFSEMKRLGGENYARFTEKESYDFAKGLLKDRIGPQLDIIEACDTFLGDVLNEYNTVCGRKKIDDRGIDTGYISNISLEPIKLPSNASQSVKLGDLLKENSASDTFKLRALENVWASKDKRMAILQRLPITAFLAREVDPNTQSDSITFHNGTFTLDNTREHFWHAKNPNDPNGCCMEHFADLPAPHFKDEVFKGFEKTPVPLPMLSVTKRMNQLRKDWDSADPDTKREARKTVLANIPIGNFMVANEPAGTPANLQTGYHLDIAALNQFMNGQGNFDQANTLLQQAINYKTPDVQAAYNKLANSEIDLNVLDDQFSIFVARFIKDDGGVQTYKTPARVDFGDGTVNYKGQKFELTAVSVHQGGNGSGHYYTYKKCGDLWCKYDDCIYGYSGEVSWDVVKADSEKNCTMLTFSKPRTAAKGRNLMDIVRVEPLRVDRNYVSDIISKADPSFSEDCFEIVKTGGNTQYQQGIIDHVLLTNPRYGYVAIIDAANSSGTGGGGVDGAIFRDMSQGGYNPSGDIRAKMPCYGNSSVRIKTGGAIIHSSYGIGAACPNVPYVVQTVSPDGIKEEKDLPLFYSAWYNAIRLGIVSGCDTLFVPGIGMGVFCQNRSPRFAKKCAKVAAQAMKDAIGDTQIRIVIIDHQDSRRNAAFFDALKEMIK